MNRHFKLLVAGFIALLAVVVVLLSLHSEKPDTSGAYTYKIINTFPHDHKAYTQGLVFQDGVLYEGTGLPGRSSLRKVELETGNALQTHKLSAEFFGEGITIFADKIIQLTFQDNVGFVYNKNTFELLRTFNYPTEGWGITHNDKHLIMSDGTPTLYFLDPETLEQLKSIKVYDRGVSVWGINELEYVDGQIYANIWPSEQIAIILPQTGRVMGWINMKGLLTEQDRKQPVDVFNGIAYDKKTGRLFVTGKFWPKLFEIKVIPVK